MDTGVSLPLQGVLQVKTGKYKHSLSLHFPQTKAYAQQTSFKSRYCIPKTAQHSYFLHHFSLQEVTLPSIARWIIDVLISSGLDTKQFSAHSTHSASSSAAALTTNDIMTHAGLACESVFCFFYHKLLKAKSVCIGHAN